MRQGTLQVVRKEHDTDRLTGHRMPGDRELLASVVQGDRQAFRALLDRHLPRMLSVARRLLGSDADAEDVTQDAALRLWRNASRVDVGEQGLGGWLYRVTCNLSLDRIRGRRNADPDALEFVAVAPMQQRAMIERDLSARVDRELQALPERQRTALVLYHFEGMSMADAGQTMGVSAEAIESLLARGRRTLRTALASEWRALLPTADDGSGGQD